MRFIDATIFIKWGQATLNEALNKESISLCGYILVKIQDGEEALTSSLVKDEVLIWFSRYKASRLSSFLHSFITLTNIKVVHPTLEDELEAAKLYGRFPLGISDLINLSVMKRYGVNEIYSLDKGFDNVPFIKRVFNELKEEDGYNNFVDKLKRIKQ
ncbi:type II toxin-antitoxin system VapC family toxin [Candidatus Bathyarchaeota archaeon]|nr:type II toxin-antitoxin system VapC family toxin [Candidatus Bathyarchaeota archaeon]